jgi:YaiO family outer membrane protein
MMKFAISLAIAFAPIIAAAQAPVTIEAGGTYHSLTAGYPAWKGIYVRAQIPTARTTWGTEVVNQQEFGDHGTYFGLSATRVINEDWHLFGSVGTSAGGFFYPRIRADATINRKWLSRRQLVTSFGGGYYAAKDDHRDFNIATGAVYYFQRPWIVEGGLRFNQSSPGAVLSQSQFIAVTQGRANRHYLVFRAGFGREAYQLTAPQSTLVDFSSQVFSGTYRQWLGDHWGVNSSVEHYRNNFYKRTGTTIGFFKQF